MVSGSSVYNEIKQKVSEVDSEQRNLIRKINQIESEIESLTGERENCYSSLAVFYLPDLDVQSIKQTLREVQGDVQKIFQEKQDRRKQLEDLMVDSVQKKKEFSLKLDDVTEKLNKKSAERDDLKKQISEELKLSDNYTSNIEKANQTQKLIAQNKERVAEAKKESEDKLPAYNQNKLFRYLLNRNFGTDSYIYGGLAKFLDSSVAKLIDYGSQKKNFDFLRAMPELMDLEVERREKDLDNFVKGLKEEEKKVEEKYNLPSILNEGEQLYSQRKKILVQIDKLDSCYASYSQERKESDNAKGEYHREAVQKLKEFLKGDSITDLKKKARETPSNEDENLIGKIEDIDIQVRKCKDNAKGIIQKRDEIAKKLGGLNDIQSKYNSADYDSSRSRFNSGFDISSLLTGYMLGQYSQSNIWDEIKRNQNFEPKPVYHSSSYDSGSSRTRSSSNSSSDSSYHNSGSGFGGGSFSSGSGFGGGSFSSGHGF